MLGQIIQIQKGKDLPEQIINKINKVWDNAFGRKTADSDKRTAFNEEIFFIIQDKNNKMLSLGLLNSVKVKFLKKDYIIQGIGGIVSIIKKEGYGKILMQAIYKYLKQRNLTGVGFCARKNTSFYEKCGFNVGKGLINRFVHKNAKGEISYNSDNDDDVLYIYGGDQFMKKVLSRPKARVYVPFFW